MSAAPNRTWDSVQDGGDKGQTGRTWDSVQGLETKTPVKQPNITPEDQQAGSLNIPQQQPANRPQPVSAVAEENSRGDIVQVSTGDLTKGRAQFAEELQDPNLRARLFNSARAEVGTQDPDRIQKYLETVLNRAAARGQSINDTISSDHRVIDSKGNRGYYPGETIEQLDKSNPPDFSPILSRVMDGSNEANYATGNESGDVHSEKAPVVATGGDERFVIEKADTKWAQSQGADFKEVPYNAPGQAQQKPEAIEAEATTTEPKKPQPAKQAKEEGGGQEAEPQKLVEQPEQEEQPANVSTPFSQALNTQAMSTPQQQAMVESTKPSKLAIAQKQEQQESEQSEYQRLMDLIDQKWPKNLVQTS